MTAVVRVGCPMWAHPPWRGRFLRRTGDELADYATWCNAVEGNTTFYAVPSATTVARWCEQAPPGFRFAFKAPRTVTHDRRLRPEAHRDLAEFLRAIEPLGDRIGPVQLQMPPSFGPDGLAALRDFVTRLPTTHRWAVELRHPGFFDGGTAHRRLDATLTAVGVGRVVLDTRPLDDGAHGSPAAIEERRTKPRLPIVTDVMGEAPIVRLIGNDDPAATLAGFEPWLDRISMWLSDEREPYLFVHQPENRESPAIARRLHAVLSDRNPGIAPLPDPVTPPVDGVTDQGRLF